MVEWEMIPLKMASSVAVSQACKAMITSAKRELRIHPSASSFAVLCCTAHSGAPASCEFHRFSGGSQTLLGVTFSFISAIIPE